jgi:dethiobiotin synthetase
MSARGYFIAGTDTGVGKTRVTTGLIRVFRSLNLRTAGMKPVAAGTIDLSRGIFNEDVLAIAEVSGQKPEDTALNPYCLREPISPNIAAKRAGISIDLAEICRHFRILSQNSDVVIVEGAGGWLTPISDELTMADIAGALGLPVILTVALRLGCQNHALLTARAIRQRGLLLAGWIGNQLDPEFLALSENVDSLAVHLGSAPLAVLPLSVDPFSALPGLRDAATKLLTQQVDSEG